MRRRPPRPSRAVLPAALLAALALAVLGGCAGRRAPIPDNIGYHELRESFGDRDLSPLRGRRILLDPGHGGIFRGVVGQDGLAEADVNLGVALWLRGLLEAADAEVRMTRTADVDFLTPADSTLAADLAARSTICDSLAPDVFVSLHHNSNAQLDRDINETQTYYPVGREGADLDLARSIHKHLVRNLEISPAKIMAGNFSVLRNATVPAVLGEPSMLSHPGVERKLSAAQTQRLEAEAYFLGLLEYFAGGVPEWHKLSPLEDNYLEKPGILAWRFVRGDSPGRAAPGLDPNSVEVRVNGCVVQHTLHKDGVTVYIDGGFGQNLSDIREVEIIGRNLQGREAHQQMSIRVCGVAGGTTLIEWTGYQENLGSESPGSTVIHWQTANPGPGNRGLTFRVDLFEDESFDATINGVEGWLTFPTGDLPDAYQLGSGVTEQDYRLSAHTSDRPSWRLSYDYAIEGHLMLMEAEHRWIWLDGNRTKGIPTTWSARAWTGRTCLGPDRPKFSQDDPGLPIALNFPLWLERTACYPILLDATHRTPWQESCDSPRDTIVWQPLVPELVGKTIVIDPHGGAAEADGVAPMGTPGRELNLRVAERLVSLLRGAGAEAVLTRDDPGFVPPEAKILLANQVDADLFITLRRAAPDGPAWRVTHHVGSRGGSAWAGYLKETLGRLAAPDTVAVSESYAYLLRQTACPAVDVSLPMPADLDAEELWRAPAYQQAVASELLSATAAWFQGDDLLRSLADPRTFMLERQFPGKPVDLVGLDWIRVDGNWLWLPPGDAATPPARLPLPGAEHTFEVRRGDRWELYVSAYGEGDRVWLRPFWTSEHQPTNPFATTETVDDPSAP